MTLATNIQTVITSGNEIQEGFPIAGQDNNTQGFRDNFSKTQTGLIAAGEALSELRTKSVLKVNFEYSNGSVTGDTANDFTSTGGITNAVLSNPSGRSTTVTVTSSAPSPGINAASYEYFRLRLTEDRLSPKLQLGGWVNISGSPLYRKIRLELFTQSGSYKIKFTGNTTFNKIRYNNLEVFDPAGDGLVVNENSSVIVDAWVSNNNTEDNVTGGIIYLEYIGTFTEE